MPHPDYPFGLHAFTLTGDGSCQHVGAPREWRVYARLIASVMLTQRLGRPVSPSELDAGVWVMPVGGAE
jgi:hypothetical protein